MMLVGSLSWQLYWSVIDHFGGGGLW